mmetsp:Transcript_71370/g.149009  ORF Transcript_71370/g.149009 Transcript_71370/m.149009 type:complete len:214 (-) Transcript_71370:25-666(-)
MIDYGAMGGKVLRDRNRWLGVNGYILGDGGFGLVDILLTPYHNPRSKIHKYFNFCLSSTRFVVEETFGRWKNRFRVLRNYQYTQKKTAMWVIYSTMVLHNICEYMRDNLPTHINVGAAANVRVPFQTSWMVERRKRNYVVQPVGAEPGLCKKCKRKHRDSCRHGLRSVIPIGNKMQMKRDAMAAELWRLYCIDHPNRNRDVNVVLPGEFSDLE